MCIDWLWKARRRVDRAGFVVLYGMLAVAASGRPTQAAPALQPRPVSTFARQWSSFCASQLWRRPSSSHCLRQWVLVIFGWRSSTFSNTTSRPARTTRKSRARECPAIRR
jgi:hypothetical protein